MKTQVSFFLKSFARSALLTLIAAVRLIPEAAEARSSGASGFYVGGGFFRESNIYRIDSNESNFLGWGAAGVVGVEINISGEFGCLVEGEYSRQDLLNTLQSNTYLEKATNSTLSAKIGILYGKVGLGVGLVKNRIDIENVQNSSIGIRTTFDGLTYQAFGRIALPTDQNLSTVVEAKYGTGTLGSMTYSELQLGIHLLIHLY